MELWLIVAGGLGTTAIACSLAFWLHLRKITKQAQQAEVLKYADSEKAKTIESVLEANKIRDRLRSDADYADVVREHYSRKDE